eukprot:gene32535-17251_t
MATSGKALDLSDLAALECQLLDSFQVDSFADLDSWPSLLSALSDDVNADLAEPLRQALGTGCEPGNKAALAGATAPAPVASLGHKVLRERAAVLLSMAGAAGGAAGACGGSEQELADRLCAQFGVQRVEDLGLGPHSELVKRVPEGAGPGSMAADAVLPVFGMCEPLGAADAGSQLSCCKLLGMSEDCGGREGSEWDDLAIKRLRDAPPLSDLHESLLWAEVFEPRLGALRKWVYQNPGQILGVYILDSPCGLYVVPPLGSMSEFAAALHGCDAPKAACQLVSALMEASMVEAVRGDLEGERAMSLLLTQLLKRIPSWGMKASCLRPLLLDPLESVLGSHRSFELLHHAAIHDSETAVLLYTLAARLASSELEFARRWLQVWMQVDPPSTATRQAVPPVVAFTVSEAPELAPSSPVLEEDAELYIPITDMEVAGVQLGGDELVEGGDDELAAELAADELSWQQTFVEDEIRRKIYGKGLQLTAEGQGVDDEKNRMLAASMSHLALHFLLELVQNAEDNQYPVGKAASLEFIRQGGCMFAISNETGFTRDSLCRIGMSSKSSTPGYIGQKGIGFKSVFKVSDAPEVHSNGFHIAFDLQREPDLGYACPVWVGPPEDELEWSSLCSQSPQDVRTVIRIPLKQENVYNADRLTNDLFGSVSPHLLLFLEKLCRISCVDAVSSRTSVSEKLLTLDCPSVVTLRQTEDGTARSSSWLVVPHHPALTMTQVGLGMCAVPPCSDHESSAAPSCPDHEASGPGQVPFLGTVPHTGATPPCSDHEASGPGQVPFLGSVPHTGAGASVGSSRDIGAGSGVTQSDDGGGGVKVQVPGLARVPWVPTGNHGKEGQSSTGRMTPGSDGGQANSGYISHFSPGHAPGSNGGQTNSDHISHFGPGHTPGSNGREGGGSAGWGTHGETTSGPGSGSGSGATGFRTHDALGIHIHEAGNTSWAMTAERLGLNSNTTAVVGARLAEQLGDLPAVVVDVVQRAWGSSKWAAKGADGADVSVHSWASKEGFSVEWVNQEEESEKPYDLVLRRNEEVVFIEVKATRSSSLNAFNVSVRQAEMMMREAGRYQIYRVYAARSEHPCITILKEPAAMWDRQHAVVIMAPAPHRG